MATNLKFLEKLKRRPYRREYLRDAITNWLAYQIQSLREQRGWTQVDLAREAGTSQPAIARNERVDYGKWNISTLIDLANAFDVGLEVRFVPWPRFLQWTDTAAAGMEIPPFSEAAFVSPSDEWTASFHASRQVRAVALKLPIGTSSADLSFAASSDSKSKHLGVSLNG
jgi:transcriptional regulator with XRE-family HTH domain